MLSIVIDVNQFLSGFIFHGMMKVVFNLVLDDKLKLYVSSLLTREVLRKLEEFEISEQIQSEVLFFIERRGILITPNIKVTVCRDPEDNYLLELAETSKADYLITRDKDLLELPNQKWKKTEILKPEDFLPSLRKMGLLNR